MKQLNTQIPILGPILALILGTILGTILGAILGTILGTIPGLILDSVLGSILPSTLFLGYSHQRCRCRKPMYLSRMDFKKLLVSYNGLKSTVENCSYYSYIKQVLIHVTYNYVLF